jgi:hypothetical protein
VKDVRAVLMNMNTSFIMGVGIAANVVSAVNDQAATPLLCQFTRADSTKPTGSYN